MKNKTDFLLLFAAGCTVAALIAFSREAIAGAAQGLNLALNTVAPRRWKTRAPTHASAACWQSPHGCSFACRPAAAA